ncbi:MAG TPA: S41 family peptidase [Candidatus Limnocylindria bacterium]|nr:S41 family peptidase [Candidatus Limnocylindria bacterium]
MRRPLALAFALLLTACTGAPGGTAPTATPAASVDIKQSLMDIAYVALADQDVHKVSSKKLLVAALDALKERARSSGGKDDVATPEFKDEADVILPDFNRFAEAAKELARKNPQLSAANIAEVAITAMMRATPDCHTYWVTPSGVVRSRPEQTRGTPAMAPANATAPDEAGLRYALIDGSIGYLTWREFAAHGTYSITNAVKKGLDTLLAQGAKAWLFDLRANAGGDPPQAMTSWFLNGEPTMRIEVRTGQAGTQTAKKELRLPDEYQLPVAVVVNDRGGSSPEVFTLGLKENKRAVIVGSKTIGCLGATSPTPLPDKSQIFVTSQEFVGAVTGTRYNNVGIPPDVPADDASAVAVASGILKDLIAKGKLYP